MVRFFQSKQRRREELLSAYLDDRLSRKDRAAVERLVITSEEWRAELESLRETVEAIRSAPRPLAPRSFALTREMVEAPARPQAWAPRPVAMSFVTAAAALLLTFSLVGGATDLFRSGPPSATTQDARKATEGADLESQAATTPPALEIAPARGEEGPGGPAGPAGAAGSFATAEVSEPPSSDSAIGEDGLTEVTNALEMAQGAEPLAGLVPAPGLLDEGRSFPWLVLEVVFGTITGLLIAATLWLYRKPGHRLDAPGR